MVPWERCEACIVVTYGYISHTFGVFDLIHSHDCVYTTHRSSRYAPPVLFVHIFCDWWCEQRTGNQPGSTCAINGQLIICISACWPKAVQLEGSNQLASHWVTVSRISHFACSPPCSPVIPLTCSTLCCGWHCHLHCLSVWVYCTVSLYHTTHSCANSLSWRHMSVRLLRIKCFVEEGTSTGTSPHVCMRQCICIELVEDHCIG